MSTIAGKCHFAGVPASNDRAHCLLSQKLTIIMELEHTLQRQTMGESIGEARRFGQAESISDTMDKPLSDGRSYRVIRLANRLEVLLIHDPDTDKAAAAMDVNVGSFSDPEDMPGTAHAIEHICFMGTKKYPGENEYSSYLTKHGGNSNAYTASTSTNYYFELSINSNANIGSKSVGSVNDDVLLTKSNAPFYGALDRFAQFFIEPLFLADSMDRELHAVDSEYKKNLQSDGWRLLQLSRSTSSEKHPIHKFSAGNYCCLREQPMSRGVDVRKRFIEFHQAHYSANRMKLVILGKESLQQLESWVEELFLDVPNKDLPRLSWHAVPALEKSQLMTQIFVKPVMEQRLLNLEFPYPDEEELFDSQPNRYIAHLIGHEGPGSALAHLRELGLADALFAEASVQCPGTTIFRIETRLTENGMRHYQEVLKIIFYYIGMLREGPPLAWISDEMSCLAEIEFRFRQNGPIFRTASGLAQLMQNPFIPRNNLLSPTLIRRFDPENIERGLSYLRPDNFRFFVIDQQLEKSWDLKEKWYGADYKLEKIPESLVQDLWADIRPSAPERSPRLRLPAVNEFIPQRLDVERKHVVQPIRYPSIIYSDSNIRVWYKKDDQFWVPKCTVRLLIRSPVASLTAMNAVMTRLYLDLVTDSLNTYAYSADIAGLDFRLAESPHGLDVETDGFNDKLPVLLEKVLLRLRDLEVKQERFLVIKERVRKAYRNFEYRDPHRQISVFSHMLLNERSWPPFQTLESLAEVTAENLRSYFPKILRQLHVEILMNGNLYRKDALEITELVKSTLRTYPLPENQWPLRRAITLPNGANYLYERVLKDPDNVNNCLEFILSVGDVSDLSTRAKLLLFAHLANDPCFNTLRTKEQLGYVVNSDARIYVTWGTWRIVIQSERDCNYLEERCDAFLADFEKDLIAMADEVFEEHKAALINRRLEKLKNMGQETLRFWAQITNETYHFEQVYHDVKNIEPLTKGDIHQLFNKYIKPSSPTRAKLSIHLIAQACAKSSKDVVQESAHCEEYYQASALDREQDDSVVKRLTSSTTIPVKITDIRAWKAELRLSAAATSVQDLKYIEDI